MQSVLHHFVARPILMILPVRGATDIARELNFIFSIEAL